MTKGFLDKVYDARTPQEARDLYNDWSSSYDAEVRANGYATPGRSARALAQVVNDQSAPILDYGCGTGLSGIAFRAEGFEIVDGMDISPDMLSKASSTGAYRRLTSIDPDDPPQIGAEDYAAIAAIGVIGAGAAPIEVFHFLMAALPRFGRFVFSFNDHALADPANIAAIDHWTSDGRGTLIYEDYGDHLPKIDLKSRVYIIEKA